MQNLEKTQKESIRLAVRILMQNMHRFEKEEEGKQSKKNLILFWGPFYRKFTK